MAGNKVGDANVHPAPPLKGFRISDTWILVLDQNDLSFGNKVISAIGEGLGGQNSGS